jgi:leucyl aminopeptidase
MARKYGICGNVSEKSGATLFGIPEGTSARACADMAGVTDVTAVALLMKRDKFEGKVGQTCVIEFLDDEDKSKLVLFGLGNKEGASLKTWKKCLAAAYKAVLKEKESVVRVGLPLTEWDLNESDLQKIAQSVTQLAGRIDYRFDRHKTVSRHEYRGIDELLVLQPETMRSSVFSKLIKPYVDKGDYLARAVNAVRDMVNEPASHMSAATVVREAEMVIKAAENPALTMRCYGKQQLIDMNMGAFLGVNKGSTTEPVLIQVDYNPRNAKKGVHLFLVGKTVIFDTGGHNMKLSGNMDKMKIDMAGGAAMLHTMYVIARLGLPVRVTALLPATDNMIGPDAMMPGDVLTSMCGKKIEITNTDAEGRLCLIDAITHAIAQGATHIVDMATLTGAMIMACGHTAAGIFGNDNEFINTLIDASKVAGEQLHHFPLEEFEEMRPAHKSEISDLVNSAGGGGGHIKAAFFISEFVGNTKWVHLDIAGVAYSPKPTEFDPKGATGFGVTTLVELAEAMST